MFRKLLIGVVFSLLVLAFSLSACGGGETVSEPVTGAGAEPTATQPAAAPTTAPTNTSPPATATPQPAATPTLTSEQLEGVQASYMTLVLLEGGVVMLEETAQQIQSGAIGGVEGWGDLIAIGAVLSAVEEELNQPPPITVLQPAWEEARIAFPLVRDVAKRWLDEEITATEVKGELGPAQQRVSHTLDLAEEALAQAFGGDREELRQWRQEAMTELRVALASTPTPDTTGIPEIEIVDIRWYKGSFGNLNFIGEVRNTGPVPASSVKVNVSLLSANGTIVATESGSSLLGVVPPDVTTPFSVGFFEDPGAFDRFEAVAQADRAGSFTLGNAYRQFELSRERVKPADEGRFALVVEATNAGGEPADLIEAAVTAYDAEGNVVGVGNAYAEQDVARPGDLVTFNVDFATTAPVDHHVVQFEGDVADVSDQVQALEITSLNVYEGFFGDAVFVGEVANRSDQPASGVSAVITLSDAAGNLLASESSNTLLEVIPPGASAPFRISLGEGAPAEVDIASSVQGQVAGQYTLHNNYKQFEIVQQNRKPADTGRFAVVGQVRNVGDRPAELVEVIVTAYDGAGEVAGVGSRFTELDTISPDAVSPFELEFAVAGEVADFKVQVEGDVAD